MNVTFGLNYTRVLIRSFWTVRQTSSTTAASAWRRVIKIAKMESCVLECLQNLHDPIPLPDDTPVRLGRTRETQIAEARCSRLQVEVQVNWKTKEIRVTQLGANTSAIDGHDLERGKTVTMSPDSTLFILKGMYPHKVMFNGADGKPITPADKSTKSIDHDKEEPKMAKKRSAETEARNGIKDDCTPAKKIKSSKPSEDKLHKDSKTVKDDESISKNESQKDKHREKSNSKESKKVKDNEKEEKAGDNEKTPSGKVTDYFSTSKSDSKKKSADTEKHKGNHQQNKRDREKSSDKKEKHSDDSFRDRDRESKSKQDQNKPESKPKSKSDRKPSSDVKKEHRKLQDISDEDDDDQMQAVSEKLQLLKQKARTERGEAKPSPSSSSKTGDKKKSSAESTGKCKVGKPAAASSWEPTDDGKLYVFTSEGAYASEKIAGFDIDGTIITTQSGRVFPKDMNDWRIWMPEVFGKLKQLVAAYYKVVFFTNQLGVGRGKVKIDDLKDKFEKVVSKLNIPVQIYISTSGGSYRKPALGMWQILKKQRNEGIPIRMSESFYVGDAAGREADWAPKKKKDFSCSDRLFAINAGLRFHTPEEFFLGHKAAPFKLPDFDPRAVSTDTPLLQDGESLTSNSQEVVVFVGLQASGKSSFAKTHLIPKGYIHINQDTLKTQQKCVSECSKAVDAGKSVVIDNTNVDPETRARYIDIARRSGKPCRCFYFDFTVSQCRHNERFREITNKEHKPINEQIFNATKSKFKPPETREGFTKIVKVNFVPHFPDKLHEKVYRQFLLER